MNTFHISGRATADLDGVFSHSFTPLKRKIFFQPHIRQFLDCSLFTEWETERKLGPAGITKATACYTWRCFIAAAQRMINTPIHSATR